MYIGIIGLILIDNNLIQRHNNIIRVVPNPQDPKNKEKATYQKIDAKTGKVKKVKKSE